MKLTVKQISILAGLVEKALRENPIGKDFSEESEKEENGLYGEPWETALVEAVDASEELPAYTEVYEEILEALIENFLE